MPTEIDRLSSTVSSEMSQKSPDPMGIGNTQWQRAAEIVAAIRAMLLPTPEAQALTRVSGRVVARMLMQIAGNMRDGANIIAVRTAAFSRIVKDYLADKPDALVVELAAGFSPRGVQLARKMPGLRVVEIDDPEVLAEKQRRLRMAHNLIVPFNLEWRGCDLSQESLASVMGYEQADVIVIEGLLPYLAREDCLKILRQTRDSLKPGGICVCDVMQRKPMEEVQRTNAFAQFRRHATSLRYAVSDAEELHALFAEAGFAESAAYLPSALAEQWNLLRPVKDYVFFAVGQRG